MPRSSVTSRESGTSVLKPRRTRRRPAAPPRDGKVANPSGKHLVIVESPAKAKTINQYLGSDYVVMASVGHVRDLPAKAPKGSKQPVPGVDLEHDFEPTYQVLPGKQKVVTDLKRAARTARDVWFATDLDREGEAIAWHLAQELGIDPAQAKRVIFNAITRSEIQKAFEHPHLIDEYKVNAQQARRILDRIVGYQVSPLLWKKVARGLSAGRVQSVAVRLVVERERGIRAFVPDEQWRITGRFTLDAAARARLESAWNGLMAQVDEKGNPPTLKAQHAWLTEHGAFKAELVEVDGTKLDLQCSAGAPRDLTADVRHAAQAAGLIDIQASARDNPEGKGLERTVRAVTGRVDPAARYRVASVETRRTSSRPSAPFITSSLQVAASSFLGFSADRTMRVAQSLYEGVSVRGEGQVGLITYMRTDSTHLSAEAIAQARQYIEKTCGSAYLPEQANAYASSKAAQEAHEAIRPTDAQRTPESVAGALTDDQLKLYRLIWSRFVSCQMTPAQWDATTVLLARDDQRTGAVFKATGRVLAFDGFLRITGVPTSSEEQMLPAMTQGAPASPFSIEPQQRFTSPPPRYTEASLVKTLEAEGIGRPSTYAAIINVIQDRKYVEQTDRRFRATDLGEVVTDKLIEGFPELMDLGYTRQMEEELDKIEDAHTNWVSMLRQFYGDFSDALGRAHDTMTHAKAEMQPAPYQCPKCGSRTVYRFGKNGRFLSCARPHKECDYAAPIDAQGRPMLPEHVDIACPEDGSPMVLRTGRFGKFLASVNYPQIKCVLNLDKKERVKYPAPPPLRTDLPCPKCGSPLNLRRGARGPWLGCSTFPKCRGRMPFSKIEADQQQRWLTALEAHEQANPQPIIRTLDGRPIPPGTPIADLVLPGGVQTLAMYPDGAVTRAKSA